MGTGIGDGYESAMGRLAHWRAPLAAWQTGQRPPGDLEYAAVRDHRQGSLVHRCELTSVIALLTDAGVFTVDQFRAGCALEAERLCVELEALFPGVRATDAGLVRVNGWPR